MAAVSRDPETLKIVVVSTPKTGNTWVRYLLAHVYNLPMREIPARVDDLDWAALGHRWIGQQHFFPNEARLTAAKAHGVIFITTIRHPGDVLISLFHHVHRTGENSELPEDPGYMQRDQNGMDRNTLAYAKFGLFQALHLSLVWLRTGVAHCVRYEDICRRPIETLTSLCEAIAPVSRSNVKRAICESEIGELRRVNQGAENFFRRGGFGGWKEELPAEIQHVLATQPPYPEQFAELGYTMEPSAPENLEPATPLFLRHPFRGQTHFENGVTIAPVLKQIYFELPEELTATLREDISTGPGSFYAWLNQPAAIERDTPYSPVMVTELAYRIYLLRPDLRSTSPDIFGTERWRYIEWFVDHGLSGYSLDDAFGLATLRHRHQAAGPNRLLLVLGRDQRFANGIPISFAISACFYSLPESIAEVWPNPLSVAPGSFFDWLRSRCAHDPSPQAMPPITELAYYLFSIRPDVRAVFPDPFGVDRGAFDYWFRNHANKEYRIASLLLVAKSKVARPRNEETFVGKLSQRLRLNKGRIASANEDL